MVKEVRVHGRLSVEVTDFVPRPGPGRSPVRHSHIWLPGLPRVRTALGPQ